MLALLVSCRPRIAKENIPASSETMSTSAPATYRDYEAEMEKSIFDIKYPKFSEYSKKVNQVIKEAAYPILDDFPNAGKYNVDCSINYEEMLKTQKAISIAFWGTSYWRGAAHPIHEYDYPFPAPLDETERKQ